MKYKVLKNRNYPGVTVGAVVVKAGEYFLSDDCKYTDEDYKQMLKKKRIKEVREEKKVTE